jgi:hypothetical protein
MMPDSNLVAWGIEQALHTHGQVAFRAHGRSMLPAVRPGAWVRVRAACSRDVRRGDLVLVRSEHGGVKLHRAVCRAGEGWRTQGDACPRPDGVAGAADVLGVATGLVVGRRQWANAPRWLQRAARRVWLACLPLSRACLPWVSSLWRSARRIAVTRTPSVITSSTTCVRACRDIPDRELGTQRNVWPFWRDEA